MNRHILLLAAGTIAVSAFSQPFWERSGLLPAATEGLHPLTAARWIWRNDLPTPPGAVAYFRRAFDLKAPAAKATFACRMDDGGTVYLNGREILPKDFSKGLRVGRNVLACEVKNNALAAGLLYAADITLTDGSTLRLVSDTATRVAATAPEGWQQPAFDDSSWTAALDEGDLLQLPWSERTDYTAAFATADERAAIAAERRRIDPLPAVLAAERVPQAEIAACGHRAMIRVNGRLYAPEIFLLQTTGAGDAFNRDIVLKTSAMGVRLYEIRIVPQDYERAAGVYDFTIAEKRVAELLRFAPEAFVSLHVNFDLPKWCAAHPEETIRYADPQPGVRPQDEFTGTPVRPSAASRPYRAECAKAIRELGRRVAAGAWGRRVAMIRVSWGVYTEWHTFGMHNAPDVSEPMVASFGRPPPSVAARRRAKRILDEKEDADLIAWNFHQQNEVADFLIGLTATVKRELPGRLAGAYYGYIWDIFPPEGANCLLGKVLDAPSVDFLSAPSPYFSTVRFGGGSYHSRSIPDAFRRRGKLFLSEDDTRHYQTVGWAKERHLVRTPELSAAVTKRNYLNGLFDGGGIQFCDPFYGVGLRMNAFDDPVVLKALAASRAAAASAGTVTPGFSADVLVVVSERERLMRDSAVEERGKPVLHWRHLYSYLPDFLYRSGVSVDFMRLEDFLADSVRPKLVVLLNAYHLTPAERTTLAARLSGQRVLDFTHADVPGSAKAWRALFVREGIVPAVPPDTYFRRQGDLFMVHTGAAGRLTVRPGCVGEAGFVELFSGRRWPAGDELALEAKGPETFLFKIAAEPAESNLAALLAAKENDVPVGGADVRVRQTAGGPRLFIDGARARPRFCYAGFGTGPTVVTSVWTKTELPFVAPVDLTRVQIHMRFPQPTETGNVSLRNIEIRRADGTAAPFAASFVSSNAFAKAWKYLPNPHPFPARYADGAWTVTLSPWTAPRRPPDLLLASSYFTLEGGVSYVMSYETKSAVVDRVQPTLYTVSADGMRYTSIPVGVSPGEEMIRKAADVGVNVAIYFPAPHRRPEGEDWSWHDAIVDRMIAANPKILLVPRVTLDAPTWWLAARPWDRMKDEKGAAVRMASVSSRAYRADALAYLARFIRHMLARYPANFGGIQPVGQSTSEWFYQDSQRRLTGYDLPTRRAWRNWLRAHGRANGQTAEVPSPEQRRRRDAASVYLDRATQADVIDFNRFLQDEMTDFLGDIFRLSRQMTKGRKLVFSFYGYVYDFTCNGPGPAQTGHYGLQRLLDRHTADIDILAAPISYINRDWTGTSMKMGAVDSVARAGVMWFDENDARTFLARPSMADSGPGLCLQTKEKTLDVLKRDLTRAILCNTGSWWMDLHGRGWWNDGDFWAMIGKTEEMEREMMARTRPFSPETALILDEETMLTVGAGTVEETGVSTRIRQMTALCGVPYSQNLLSDVLRNGLDAKFQIYFATRENEAKLREKIAAAPRKGVTRLWLRMPGDPGFADEPKVVKDGADTDVYCPLKKICPSYDPVFLKTYRPLLLYGFLCTAGVHRYFGEEMCGRGTAWSDAGYVTVQAFDDVTFTLHLKGRDRSVTLRKGETRVYRE